MAAFAFRKKAGGEERKEQKWIKMRDSTVYSDILMVPNNFVILGNWF